MKDKESIMTAEMAQALRERLCDQISQLQAAAARTRKSMRNHETKVSDPLDRACMEFERSIELLIRERDRGALREMQRALDRLDAGVFGMCEKCGGSIEVSRLMAKPESRICMGCMKMHDGTSGVRRGPPKRS